MPQKGIWTYCHTCYDCGPPHVILASAESFMMKISTKAKYIIKHCTWKTSSTSKWIYKTIFLHKAQVDTWTQMSIKSWAEPHIGLILQQLLWSSYKTYKTMSEISACRKFSIKMEVEVRQHIHAKQRCNAFLWNFVLPISPQNPQNLSPAQYPKKKRKKPV